MDLPENENATKEGDEISSTELEEETCVRIKKKSRRVSFAEITSVHVFDRDEDYETPPDIKPNSGGASHRTPTGGSPRPYLKLLHDEDSAHRLHLTPTSSLDGCSLQANGFEHSVPEGDTPCSVSDRGTPDEEGEFFGPVSLWHIAPGMNALSPVTDDITLDCTTFSLQFGKLMPPDEKRSNPGEDIKTPAFEKGDVSLATEDFKTPAGETLGVSPGNFMDLTKSNKPAIRRLVSDDDHMSLIEENQLKLDYASLSPDLCSLLAEKFTQMQSGISSSDQNHDKDSFGSSSQQQSAGAMLDMGEEMESKDPINAEVKGSTIQTIATDGNYDTKLRDIEVKGSTIETSTTESKYGTNLTADLEMNQSNNKDNNLARTGDSPIFDFEGQQQQQQRQKLLICGQEKENKDLVVSEVAPYTEISQSTVDIGETTHCEDNKLIAANGSCLFCLEEEQQEQQKRRSLAMESGIELKDAVDVKLQNSTTRIMSTRHNSDTKVRQDVNKNQPPTLSTAMEYNTGMKLSTEHGLPLLNFEGEQLSEEQQERSLLPMESAIESKYPIDVEMQNATCEMMTTSCNDTEVTLDIETNQCTSFIPAMEHNTQTKLSTADDSSCFNLDVEEHQHRMLLNPGCHMDVEMNEFDIAIASTKHSQDTKLTSPDDSSLCNFEGEQQYQQQRQNRMSLNLGWDTEREDPANIKRDRSSVEIMAAKTNNETNQSGIEIVASRHNKYLESSSDDIKLTLAIDMSQSTIDIGAVTCKADTKSSPSDRSSPFHFEGEQQQHQQQQQSKSLDLGWDMEPKDPVNVKEESSGIKTIRVKPNGDVNLSGIQIVSSEHITDIDLLSDDIKLTPDIEMSQSFVAIVSTQGNMGDKSTSSDQSPPFNFGGEKQQQQRLLKLECDMESREVVSVEVDRSSLDIMEARHDGDSKLTSNLEMNQSTMEIEPTKGDENTKFTVGKGTSLLNLEREHQQQQHIFQISSEGSSTCQKSKLSENQFIEGFKKGEVVSERIEPECSSPRKVHCQHIFSSLDDLTAPANLATSGNANFICSPSKNPEHLNLSQGHCNHAVPSTLQGHIRTMHMVTPVYDKHKQAANFKDDCGLIKDSLEHELYSLTYPEHHIQECKELQNQEESVSQQTHACSTLRDAEDSVCKQSGLVKLNTGLANTTVMNEGEASTVVAQDMSKTKLNHGNNASTLSHLKQSFSHEKIRDWQRFEQHQIPVSSSQESMMLQHARIDISLKTNESVNISEKALPVLQLDDQGHHGKKRKSEEMKVQEKGSLIKSSGNDSRSCQRKPLESVYIVQMNFEHSDGISPSNKKLSVGRTHFANNSMQMASTKPTEVPCKLSQEGKELCLPLISKHKSLQECLSFIFRLRPELCLVQDTLKHLQKDMDDMKISTNQRLQALHGKKQLEKEKKQLSSKHQRLGNIKWLQQMLAYEKSKLMLLQGKKNELEKKAQELHCGCQEVDELKSRCLQKQGPSYAKTDSSVMKAATMAEKDTCIQLLKTEIMEQAENFAKKKVLMEETMKQLKEENQKACERVIIVNRELGVLRSKIRELCEFYCGFFNIEGNATKEEITESIENHVKKRIHDSFILQDMQLWRLKKMKSKPGEHFLELDYCDIICQRFIIQGGGPDAIAFTGHSLNYETIEKVFPFMNASAAFEILVGSKPSWKIGGAGNIHQTIREISFHLGTLIDVLDEVQLCQKRLHNLRFARFNCGPACEVHLELTFIDCTVGLKTIVVLDMNNLRRGVYPSHVLPLQVEIEQFGRQTGSLLVSEEINEAIQSLKPGYPRIKKLCDCVSWLIESKGCTQ